jgi:hypothetical protein
MSLSDLDETLSAREGMVEGPQTGGATGAVGAISAVDALVLARRSQFKLEVDGDDLAYEVPDYPAAYCIIDLLRPHKPGIVGLLLDERRAVVRWIADNFRSSPIGQCALCVGGKREDDPFVRVFVGEDQADLHAGCHPIWLSEQEAKARCALGIETPVGVIVERDVSLSALRLGHMPTRDVADPCSLQKSPPNVSSKGPRHEPRNI